MTTQEGMQELFEDIAQRPFYYYILFWIIGIKILIKQFLQEKVK